MTATEAAQVVETRRTLIRVTLQIVGRWAVGGVANAAQLSAKNPVHLPVLRDRRAGGDGVPYLPASSLVGSLRAHADTVSGSAETAEWFGPRAEPESKLTPSRLWALGTTMTGSVTIAAAGNTAIDAHRRAAAGGSLRTAEYVEASPDDGQYTAVVWYLQHDSGRDEQLIEWITTWRPVIGRRRTAGMGSARVSALEVVTLDLARDDHLTWWLSERSSWLSGGGSTPAGSQTMVNVSPPQPRTPLLEIEFRLAERVYVGTGEREETSGAATDSPLNELRTLTSNNKPIIPGSAWRGLFRHRICFILKACGVDDDQAPKVVRYLFGAASGADGVGGRGILTFRETVLSAPKQPAVRSRTHVAINRFTGGAADGQLYSVEAATEGSSSVLVVESAEDLHPAIANVLRHVVRDLADGIVGVGGMTSRGYGTLRVEGELAPVDPVDVTAIVAVARSIGAEGSTQK